MARKLFDGMEAGEAEQDPDRKEYNSPEERDVGLELFNRYILLRNEGVKWSESAFESEVKTLELLIKDSGEKFKSQSLIGSLTALLKDESDGEKIVDLLEFPRTIYLTAIVQALYNLNQGDEFTINIRDWSKDGDFSVGWNLKGKEDKRLTLHILNRSDQGVRCGSFAEYCNFIEYDDVRYCGFQAENCKFICHKDVNWCGVEAENSTSDLMPSAKIIGYAPSKFKGNKLRRLNDKGEVRTIQTLWLNLYHNMKSRFRSRFR